MHWQDSPAISADQSVLRPATEPFDPHGGMKLLTGKLGRSIIKVSAVKPEHRYVKAPAIIFDTQEALKNAFDAGELERDFIAVVRFQGPRANGMPELHKLTPYLGILQERGFKVALVTDGRMSGASGKIPAAIHLYPEAIAGGPIAKIQNGDMLVLDTAKEILDVLISADELSQRTSANYNPAPASDNYGRDLFAGLRANVSSAEEGAATFL